MSAGVEINRVHGPAGEIPDCFTIDVEDWFHILEVAGTPSFSEWDALPSRVERNFLHLLDLLSEAGVKATCFTLGWVAKRFPALLREAASRGHEMASHGYGHQLVHTMTQREFREDLRAAKTAIEDATGKPVTGYRAPGFSITARTPWAFEEIADAGHRFDSSVFPGQHRHGGVPDAPRKPYVISTSSGSLLEFPVTVADTPLGAQCFFGGGYLRLWPWPVIRAMANRARTEQRGVIWYIHPREIDPSHPRLHMSFLRRFKSYVNLAHTSEKLSVILKSSKFVTLGELSSRFAADLQSS